MRSRSQLPESTNMFLILILHENKVLTDIDQILSSFFSMSQSAVAEHVGDISCHAQCAAVSSAFCFNTINPPKFNCLFDLASCTAKWLLAP